MSEYFSTVKKIIAEKTGLDSHEIKEDSYFEDDLNVGEMELVEILSEIEDVLQVDLVEEKDNIESVADLLDILSEKLD
ncbi:MAG TPA: hypothetical protein VLI92_02400 [Candidatus Saccharimonadales bacterium]|nr:hypothetical protein [Candidatus Saccharimonadales bacterium]